MKIESRQSFVLPARAHADVEFNKSVPEFSGLQAVSKKYMVVHLLHVYEKCPLLGLGFGLRSQRGQMFHLLPPPTLPQVGGIRLLYPSNNTLDPKSFRFCVNLDFVCWHLSSDPGLVAARSQWRLAGRCLVRISEGGCLLLSGTP